MNTENKRIERAIKRAEKIALKLQAIELELDQLKCGDRQLDFAYTEHAISGVRNAKESLLYFTKRGYDILGNRSPFEPYNH